MSMNDGTTATQVSPIIEETEVSNIRNIFDRAANAIVQASELAKQVNELIQQVALLKADIEYVRQRNSELDNLLHDVRSARDKAQSEVNTLTNENFSLKSANDILIHDVNSAKTRIEYLEKTLAMANNNLEAEQFKVLDLEEKLSTATTQLDDIKSFAASAFGLMPKPVATPVPEPVTEPNYQPWTQTGSTQDPPVQPEPVPSDSWANPPRTQF